jgi:hypothetical protein
MITKKIFAIFGALLLLNGCTADYLIGGGYSPYYGGDYYTGHHYLIGRSWYRPGYYRHNYYRHGYGGWRRWRR